MSIENTGGKTAKLNLGTISFLVISSILAIGLSIVYFMFFKISIPSLILFIVYYTICSMSITCGYHRLFSHRAYKAHPILKWLLIFFGAGTFQNSVLHWTMDHRLHHKYVDTPRDPYNIKQGFWHAHIGWLMRKRDYSDHSLVQDLIHDKAIIWQDKYYSLLAVISGYILPGLIAGFGWGDWLGGFVLAGLLRGAIGLQATFCVNSVCHYFGKSKFEQSSTAKENLLVAFLTFGEGYHDYHHKYSADYRNGHKFYHFDPSKWFIQFMYLIRLVNHLKLRRGNRYQVISWSKTNTNTYIATE